MEPIVFSKKMTWKQSLRAPLCNYFFLITSIIATTKTITAITTRNKGIMLGFDKDKEKKINQIEKNTLNHPCITTPPLSFRPQNKKTHYHFLT